MSDELLHGFVECLDSDDIEEELTDDLEDDKGIKVIHLSKEKN